MDDLLRRTFPGVDMDTFWDDDVATIDDFVDAPPPDELIASVQDELGYRLPASYVTLMRSHNGGFPGNTSCPTPDSDEVEIEAILGIGRRVAYSLAGEFGAELWQKEWGYPPIGVYFGTCPSGGHDMIAFDYRDCGPDGEPQVVHVDQDRDYRITVLAPDFVSFVQALE